MIRLKSASVRGFSLLTALLLMLLMNFLALALHLRVTTHWKMAAGVESQLHALILAENGIEYARTLLPHVDIDTLLVGSDAKFCEEHEAQWRNPLSFTEALHLDPSSEVMQCDDGWPACRGQTLLPNGHGASGTGRFFIRFSNNREESPQQDNDKVVLVRSMAIVPNRVHDPFLPGIKNNVALVEALFRQEKAFLLPSPLTILADSGLFEWQENLFFIDGGEQHAVSLVPVEDSTLYEDLITSLSLQQQERIRGGGMIPSIRDAAPLYLSEPIYQPLFQPKFWNRFLTELPRFADGMDEGIAFLPGGGRLGGSFAGVLVVRGDFTLQNGARIAGILLHLGDGRLTLEHGAEVSGGIWMSNLDASGEILKSRAVSLKMSGSATVRFDGEAVRRALAWLPPTQLGWRILFPETVE